MDCVVVGKAFAYAAGFLLAAGGLGGMMPWKSRRLSTASIQRRIYWTCCSASAVLLFASPLPDWRSGLFAAFAFASTLVIMAYVYTSHIKIGGRIYEFMRDPNQPDPPPALGRRDDPESDVS